LSLFLCDLFAGMTLSGSLCGSVFDNDQLFDSKTGKMTLVIYHKEVFWRTRI